MFQLSKSWLPGPNSGSPQPHSIWLLRNKGGAKWAPNSIGRGGKVSDSLQSFFHAKTEKFSFVCHSSWCMGNIKNGEITPNHQTISAWGKSFGEGIQEPFLLPWWCSEPTW